MHIFVAFLIRNSSMPEVHGLLFTSDVKPIHQALRSTQHFRSTSDGRYLTILFRYDTE